MRYFLLGLPYALQLLCILHMYRNGRSGQWLYIIVFVPYVGGIAYILLEVLPALRMGTSLAGITDIVARTINPSAKIERYRSQAEYTPSFYNRKLLADEYLASGLFPEAIATYDTLLVGAERNNAQCLLMKAKALYGAKEYAEAWRILSDLEKSGFPFAKESEILVRLKTGEHILEPADTRRAYEEARSRFNSFEIQYYWLDYLARSGDLEKARAVVAELKDLREHLRANRITFERAWLNRALALGRGLGKGA